MTTVNGSPMTMVADCTVATPSICSMTSVNAPMMTLHTTRDHVAPSCWESMIRAVKLLSTRAPESAEVMYSSNPMLVVKKTSIVPPG